VPLRDRRRDALTARLLGNVWRKRKVAERTLQAQVERLVGVLGWLPFHIPANVVVCERCGHKNLRAVRRGFPDLMLVRTERLPPGPIRFIELKTMSGTLDADQRHVHALLRRSGVAVDTIKPNELDRLLEILHDY